MNNLPSLPQPLKPSRRRIGKVARLPKEVRDHLNYMIRDGLPHARIILNLGDYGKGLNKDNIINWEKGGYKEWLTDRIWLDEMFSKLEFARDMLQDPDSQRLREAGLVIAVKQMYGLIQKFEPASFLKQLADEPNNYSRILNSLSKLAEVGLRYDRERTETTRTVAREGDKSKKAAGLTDDLLRQYEDEFKLLRRPPKGAELRQERPGETSAPPDQQKIAQKIALETPGDA